MNACTYKEEEEMFGQSCSVLLTYSDCIVFFFLFFSSYCTVKYYIVKVCLPVLFIGQEGCGTEGMQDRRNAGQKECKTEGMQDMRKAGHEES